jgi:hypothetical protein
VAGQLAPNVLAFKPDATPTYNYTSDTSWTMVTIPGPSGPISVLPAATLHSLEIANPSDSMTVRLGVDNTFTGATSYDLYPGNRVTIRPYASALWAGAARGPLTFFYRTT